jgi:hypothetical protein
MEHCYMMDKKPFLHLKDSSGYDFKKDKIGTGI